MARQSSRCCKRLAATALAALTLAVPALAQTPEIVRIGVSPGPHAEILEQVKPLLAKKGIDLKIVEFSDYVVPNQALDAGELEANSFQNQPYLDNQVKDRGFKIVSVGLTVNFPLGIYSSKYKSWAEVPDGSSIAIQNDPTNGGRSLLLLTYTVTQHHNLMDDPFGGKIQRAAAYGYGGRTQEWRYQQPA